MSISGENLFHDKEKPRDNPLVVDITNWRQEYYREDFPILSDVGLNRTRADPGDEFAGPPGFVKGTVVGDAWEFCSNLANEKVIDSLASGLGLAATALDFARHPDAIPVGQVMGWMMTHFEPFREVLDALGGNEKLVRSYAKSWQAVSRELTSIATGWHDSIAKDIASWTGTGADAYRNFANDLADRLGATSAIAASLGVLTNQMADIVDVVHGVVQQICSSLLADMITWTLELLVTEGASIPYLIQTALARIGTDALRVSKILLVLGKVLKSEGQWINLGKVILHRIFDEQEPQPAHA